jgi:predicted nucleic acid-binding protein
MTYLVDSDVLIEFFNKTNPGEAVVKEMLGSGHNVAISVLSVTEICAGWLDKERTTYLPILYELFNIEPITSEVAELAGTLRHDYMEKHNRKLKTIDTLIAATAIHNNYRLATKNVKDYPMPELKLRLGLSNLN